MSSNYTRNKLTPRHGANSSLNDMNSSLYDMNSSFNSSIANMCAKSEEITKYQLMLRCKKNDVTGAVTHFSDFDNSESQCFTSRDNKRYHSTTTKHSAAKPSRQPLAIFVSKTDLINTQTVTTGADKRITSSNRYTYGAGHSDVSYDGTSEPNKTPPWGNKFRRLNAVVVVPFIPFFKNYPTQTNHSGGYHA
ncbi:hypothetical protein [Psychrobacter maritimus]|uniref:hypothetical protein n=1 Tax=Psychrobacter maritimus TaxID=256325 RepID=UPI00191ACD77|nr:hypothetical protein [Psychrobacter maritimus]